MVQEHLALSKCRCTYLAGTGRLPSFVDPLVPLQCSGPREGLAADVTAVRFDPSVAPYMRLHVLKRLPAHLAGPARANGFPVRGEVVRQVLRSLEAFPTDSAGIFRGVCMRFHVSHKIPFVTKGFSTHHTAIT